MRLIDIVLDFLEEEEWKYDVLESEDGIPKITLSFKGHNGSWSVFLRTDEEKCYVHIHSLFPQDVPKNKRMPMAEFLTRTNYGIILGCFQMDFSDGQIVFNTGIDMEGGELTHNMVDNLLRSNLVAMDKYFIGMMNLIYSDKSPESIYNAISDVSDSDEEYDEEEPEYECN